MSSTLIFVNSLLIRVYDKDISCWYVNSILYFRLLSLLEERYILIFIDYFISRIFSILLFSMLFFEIFLDFMRLLVATLHSPTFYLEIVRSFHLTLPDRPERKVIHLYEAWLDHKLTRIDIIA